MSANQTAALQPETMPEILDNPDVLPTLRTAADSFVHQQGDSTEIWAASRDWFLEEWGRDTFISLPGLLLTTGRYETARQVFLRFAAHEQNGLIPNIIRGAGSSYNTADAALWFIHALKAYTEATQDWPFIGQLLPTVRSIITHYAKGTTYEHASSRHRIGMDERDGLIVSPAQATWMDADPAGDGSTIVTPRNGKCVEINALWYGALRFACAIEKQLDSARDISTLTQQADLVRTSFADKFWNDAAGCLYDVLEGDPHGAAIRPNQIIAISRGEDLLNTEQQRQVLVVVQRELLTPGGLRTLSPQDPQYCGYYDTSAPVPVKDLAYHQGTVWPWLLGPYCDTLAIVRGHQGALHDEIRHEIGQTIAPLVRFCLDSEFKSLPEVFSGDPPYDPGGTTSQAWSVAEVLRLSKWF